MSGFVYLWLDRKHRRFYLGSHWGSPDDGYICSSDWMRKAHLRRPQDFKRRLVKAITTSRRDLLIEEHRWLQMIKPSEIKVRYYNLKITRDNFWHTVPEDLLTVGEKISKALKGRKWGNRNRETCEAISAGKKAGYEKRRRRTGAAISEEMRETLRNARKGIRHTDAHKGFMKAAIREARAANPDWDKIHDRTCAYCGTRFKGRESQRHCSPKCRANHWYHSKNPDAARCPAMSDGIRLAKAKRFTPP